MELAANALTTVEQVKLHNGIDLGDSSQNELITFLINACSAFIERRTGRKFGRGNYTEYLTGSGSDVIYLKTPPVSSIVSVTENGSVLSASGYSYDPVNGKLQNENGLWDQGLRKITVVYWGGYILPKDGTEATPSDLPDDINLACVKLVSEILNKKDSEGVRSASAGGLNVQWEKELDTTTDKIIKSYRIYNV